MKNVKFDSQISELRAALLFFKTTSYELQDLLKKEEMEAVKAYLKTSSYSRASVLIKKDPVMVYIHVKGAIEMLNIFKSLFLTEGKKAKKRAFARSLK